MHTSRTRLHLVTTGGVANPIIATVENALAAVMSVLAVVLPIALGVIAVLVLAIFAWIGVRIYRRRSAARVALA